MKMNHKESEDETGNWLSTFNDMVTLLLTFFVLILSLSTPDTAKLKKVAVSMSTAFGLFEKGSKIDVNIFTPFVIPIKTNKAKILKNNKEKLASRINKAVKTIAGLERNTMKAKVIKEGVSVVIAEKLLFKTGMAEMGKKNHSVIKAVLFPILQETEYPIRIEGHTDDVPISNGRFSSNRELSVARAVNVVKFLISEGGIIPERLSAVGYADLKPLLPSVNNQNRELNKRVEIILTLKKG